MNLRFQIYQNLIKILSHLEYDYIRHNKSRADAYICYAIEKEIPGCLKPPRKMIILSIRGTSEVGDMAQDLKMWQVKFKEEADKHPKIKVHAGIFRRHSFHFILKSGLFRKKLC